MQDFIDVQAVIGENNLQEEGLRDNGTLLISELKYKVFLPYTVEEVISILNSNQEKYSNFQEVINEEFTKPLSYYRDPYASRFKESVKLITEREKMSRMDGYSLGIELFGKRYLHPAIISACKNLDELNVYLDCLDKNELDDFKIFEIKYELFPMILSENKIARTTKGFFRKIIEFIKKLFRASKKSTFLEREGKH